MGCLPSLYETKVDAVRTVELEKNGEKTEIKETENYTEQSLKKHSKICLDFGNHQVGLSDIETGL